MRTAIGKGHVSLNLTIRRAFGLYANVRPAKTVPGVETPYSKGGVDCVIVRENTEGEYSGIEHTVSRYLSASYLIQAIYRLVVIYADIK